MSNFHIYILYLPSLKIKFRMFLFHARLPITFTEYWFSYFGIEVFVNIFIQLCKWAMFSRQKIFKRFMFHSLDLEYVYIQTLFISFKNDFFWYIYKWWTFSCIVTNIFCAFFSEIFLTIFPFRLSHHFQWLVLSDVHLFSLTENLKTYFLLRRIYW